MSTIIPRRVLNLYAGLGGNRRDWNNCKVTAVESDKPTAATYKQQYQEDTVIVTDAHEFLLNSYMHYDFIWSSPPCQSHSRAIYPAQRKQREIECYADMTLYQEILFLKHYSDASWVVENVNPYYTPLIPETARLGRHLFWSNFNIATRHFKSTANHKSIVSSSKINGYDLSETSIKDKRQALRNMTSSDIGAYIYEQSLLHNK